MLRLTLILTLLLSAATTVAQDGAPQDPPAEPDTSTAQATVDAQVNAAQTDPPANTGEDEPVVVAPPANADEAEPDTPEPDAPVDVVAPPITIEPVHIDTAELYVGQPVTLTLEVHPVTNEEVVGVQITDTPFVEVVNFEVLPSDEAGTLEVSVTLAGFRPGTHTIAGLTVRLLALDGTTLRATAPSFELPVLAILDAEDDTLVAPGDFVPVYTQNRGLLYGGILLLGGFLLGISALLWRRRKLANTPILVELPPPRPADEEALEALDSLEHSGWLESGRHIDYHLRLSEILREFIGRSFAFHAPEMTSPEIMQALARIPDDTDPFMEAIGSKLDEMDMVKFAKATLPLDESRALLSSTCELVVAVTEQLREREALQRMEAERLDPEQDQVSEVPL